MKKWLRERSKGKVVRILFSLLLQRKVFSLSSSQRNYYYIIIIIIIIIIIKSLKFTEF